jgi:capsular exopolysaccharide synthesis family protein
LRGEYEDTTRSDGVTFGDYVDVVRRRKWFIVMVAILVVIPAIIFTSRQQSKYEASSQVIQLGGGATGLNSTEIERRAQTDASLARVPSLAGEVLSTTGAQGSPEDFLAKSSVKASQNSDVLTFTVRDSHAALAVSLANAYARAFAKYRTTVGEQALTEAKAALAESIKQTETALARAKAQANGAPSAEASVLSQKYASLLDQQQRLLSAEAANPSNLVVVPATKAVRSGAQTGRNAILALAFGVLLGTILSFILEALDSRIRTAEELGDQLALPLLGRIPAPLRNPTGRRDRLTMLAQPRSPEAEPFRILRTNVDFANRPFGARTIMFTSAVAEASRTAILANLGVAFARSGRQVTLVDLDLRNPSLASLFGLRRKRGITDVAMKRTRLTQALATIPLSQGAAEADEEEWSGAGTLEVLPAGSTPPDPGDFVGMQPLADILHLVGERSDLVLIDAPPLLDFGDAVALSANVDAIVVVITLGAIKRPEAEELRRILDVCPAPKLGYVLAGVESTRTNEVSARAARPKARAGTSADQPRDAEVSDVA